MVLGAVAAPAVADPGNVAAYLNARAAAADGRSTQAAAGFARILAAASGSDEVAVRAYRQGLIAGDEALVHRAAAMLGNGAAPADVSLVALSDAARGGDIKAFDAAVAKLDSGLLRILTPALRGWSAYVRRTDPTPSLVVGTKADPIASRLAEETRALLTIARGDTAAGLAMVTTLRSGGSPIDLRLAAAQLLFGAGHADDARALLAGNDPMVVGFRKGAPAMPTLAFATSRLLTRIAADLMANGPTDLSIALTRAALRADAGDDRARLLLAEALGRADATDRALAVLAEVRPDSAAAEPADAGRIAILAAAGREAEALATARTVAARRQATAADWQRYADRLLVARRYGEAARWYRRVADAGTGDDWAAWLQYGGALDQAGRWRAARPAIARAVALAPAEPLALNYLGYGDAEHGGDMAGATRLLEHALALKPGDPSITDSLGWVYHLGGDTPRALPLVERAAVAEPDNAEIAEHLGDLYWTVGRRYEARYAWRAAALTADSADAARLASRIDRGVPAR